MATNHPRIQVTVDPELAAALAAVDASPRSRSKLVRDLALRGAQVIEAERKAQGSAVEVLLAIADGDERYDLDFGAAAEIHAQRGDRLP